MSAQTLSHYELLEKIGEGGMGVIFKARDVKLDRLVALKFLSPQFRAAQESVSSFLHEARALSKLNHPNIATIYEVEEEGDQPFLALEYLPGGTVKERIREARENGGTLPVRQVIDYALLIAQALAHAHRHGIVHRDVKPDNALLTAEGTVKLTDFGVAQVAGRESQASADMTLGTAAYMSPEQAQGLEIDHRSDIFSFGIVLFELAAGEVPFSGSHEALILYDIVHADAPPLRRFRQDLPPEIQRIVSRAIQKQPDERYQSMEDVLAELRSLAEGLRLSSSRRRTPDAAEPTVAVLPFVDMSSERDQQYFCEGIAEEITNALTGVKGLKVVSRTSSFQFRARAYDVREIGAQLGVHHVVEGSVRKAGDRLRITVQLIAVEDGYHLWSERYDRKIEDVFAIQDEISQAIVDNLKIKLLGQRQQKLVKPPTYSFEAYNLYLQGRYHLNQRTGTGLAKSIECFEKAASEDCDYAQPYAGLAEAYVLQGTVGYLAQSPDEAFSKASEAARTAIEKDETCAEAHLALALVHYRADWDWNKAERRFRRAIEINDGYATGHHQYAMFLAAMNRLEQALDEIRRAHELDPLSLLISTAVGRILHFSRRFDEAIEQCRRTIEMNPQFPLAHFDVAIAYGNVGRYSEAIEAFRKWAELLGDTDLAKGGLAVIYAEMGEREKALQLAVEVAAAAETRAVSPMTQAIVYVRLGELDKAMDFLEEAYARRDSPLVYLQVEPTFDPIRVHPRYPKLIEKIGLPS